MVPEEGGGRHKNTIFNCCEIRWYMAINTVINENVSILVFRTLIALWLDLVGTLVSYTSRKCWKLQEIRLIILTSFEVYATGNTAQLGFCGGCKLSPVLPTLLCYWFDLRTTLESYTLRKMVKIRAILVYFDYFWSPYNGQHYAVELLWKIWIESSPPNTSTLLVWPESHFGVVYSGKIVNIERISVI